MTSASMLRVLEGLISGNSLLSGSATAADGRQLSRLGLLGHHRRLLGKEGDLSDGPAGLHTFFGILAGTIPVVIAVNSDLVDDISAIVQASLWAATSPRSPARWRPLRARSPASCAWISRQWPLDLRGRVHARPSACKATHRRDSVRHCRGGVLEKGGGV